MKISYVVKTIGNLTEERFCVFKDVSSVALRGIIGHGLQTFNQ
jgi:hypothetical protein